MTDRLNNSCWTKYHRCKYLGISGDDSDMFCVKYRKELGTNKPGGYIRKYSECTESLPVPDQDRTQLCKDFTILTGGHWYEEIDGDPHSFISSWNPTYTNPADVLKVMKENGRYDEFIISTFCDHSFNQNTFFVKMFLDNFIIEPDALLKAAVKFLEEKL